MQVWQKKAAYFALSWYYTWDVPFAPGQMLGDIGLKTRGWGNVSVENNHIDVFIFDFADVLHWLSKEYNEPRFADFAAVISSSMRQLLPYEGHQCGIAKERVLSRSGTAHQLGLRQERQRVLQPYLRTGMGSCFLCGSCFRRDDRKNSSEGKDEATLFASPRL